MQHLSMSSKELEKLAPARAKQIVALYAIRMEAETLLCGNSQTYMSSTNRAIQHESRSTTCDSSTSRRTTSARAVGRGAASLGRLARGGPVAPAVDVNTNKGEPEPELEADPKGPVATRAAATASSLPALINGPAYVPTAIASALEEDDDDRSALRRATTARAKRLQLSGGGRLPIASPLEEDAGTFPCCSA